MHVACMRSQMGRALEGGGGEGYKREKDLKVEKNRERETKDTGHEL